MARVVIEMEGGVIHEITADEETDLIVFDYDTEGVEDEELCADVAGKACTVARWEVGTYSQRVAARTAHEHGVEQIMKLEDDFKEEALSYIENEMNAKNGRERQILGHVLTVLRRDDE